MTALRKAGATNQEAVLAGLLAARTRQPALQSFREVKSGHASWGVLLQRAKIEPSAIEPAIGQLVKAAATR